ncbi:hypothetical protein U9M48_038254 [Paspalum notatum var. saurae]|uniref:Benzyl alcohol O-benzoyltransferase n=1 Tax=Paspalum notatum var. saurae TaxID=547442 RepID=A0AAQ3UL01_PASNO
MHGGLDGGHVEVHGASASGGAGGAGAPTPRELKLLSDIDDQDGLRFHAPIIQLYRRNASMDGQDPVAVVRDAVAKALTHYYPFAGRLRELHGRKLAVDCTAEGVLFIEADADVRLEQFGDAVHPPFPCLEELLFDVPGSSAILDSPLLLVQVTRLACGGFILGVRICHVMADGEGMVQFLEAVAELARGAAAPTVQPVWARELLMARDPPRPSSVHREYDEVPPHPEDAAFAVAPLDETAQQRFTFFGPRDIASIRARLPPRLRTSSTTFDVLTGFLWKCRTMALAPDAAEEMRLVSAVSARGRGRVVPRGYYGNAIALPVAISTAGELCANPVGYAVELVQKAKAQVDAEYIQSVADLMVLRGRPTVAVTARLYMVSDLTKCTRYHQCGVAHDCGWGQPVYAGVASLSPTPGIACFLIPFKNAEGEDGIIAPTWLPGRAMDRFAEEMDKLLRPPVGDHDAPQQHRVLPAKNSAL